MIAMPEPEEANQKGTLLVHYTPIYSPFNRFPRGDSAQWL